MKEREISAGIMKWLRSLPDNVAWKITDFNNVGFPDIAGCYKGMFYALEVKTKKGRSTAKQKYEAGRILDAGGRHAEVRSLAEAQDKFFNWFGLDRIYFESIRPRKRAKSPESRGRELPAD